jgi:HEAT repeat protein
MIPDKDREAIIRALLSGPDDARVAALAALSVSPLALDAEAMEAVARCLAAGSKTVRRRAADTLAEIARRDRATLSAIRKKLADPNFRIRFGAAYALATVGQEGLGTDAVSVLCEAMADGDGDVRWAAAELLARLGRFHRSVIIERLIALAGGPSAVARRTALYCLRDLAADGDDVLGIASASLRAPDSHERLAALALLSASFPASETASSLVLERLECDREAGVRRAAAIALGGMKVRAEQSIAALRRAQLQTSDGSLARAARAALDRLGARDAG